MSRESSNVITDRFDNPCAASPSLIGQKCELSCRQFMSILFTILASKSHICVRFAFIGLQTRLLATVWYHTCSKRHQIDWLCRQLIQNDAISKIFLTRHTCQNLIYCVLPTGHGCWNDKEYFRRMKVFNNSCEKGFHFVPIKMWSPLFIGRGRDGVQGAWFLLF